MKHQRTLFASGVIAPRRARPAHDLAKLRRIEALAVDLVRLDAEKHRAITTGTGAELQEAADRYFRTWQALKQAVAA